MTTENFILFHIPKTAGTSIRHALGNTKRHRSVNFHGTVKHGIDKIGWEYFNTLFSFAIVRNPWERMHSLYYHIIQNTFAGHKAVMKSYKEMGFTEWCKEELENFHFQHDWHHDGVINQQIDYVAYDEEPVLSFIGRYENLQEDFAYICKQIGKEDAILPRVNTSIKPHYSLEYNDEARDKVATLFEKDIILFDYKFENES